MADPRVLVDRYEALRREAVEGVETEERGLGLGLFLTRGLSAWLEALSALPPQRCAETTEEPVSPPDGRPALPSVRTALRNVLVSMVLACTPAEENVP
jgi:hypothetical protein